MSVAKDPRGAILALHALHDGAKGQCTCCGYEGKFENFRLRPGARCPKCRSLERHRLLALAAREGFVSFGEKSVLHFAPEESITRIVTEGGAKSYTSADLEPGRADRVLNIEAIDCEDESFDTVVASHILEHVDDRKALAEILRVLRPGGQLVAMVPIVEGWDSTYENPAVSGRKERTAHFGQQDHVRYYGADFRQRVKAAGFELSEFTAGGAESVRYRIGRGSKVFLGVKPGSPA